MTLDNSQVIFMFSKTAAVRAHFLCIDPYRNYFRGAFIKLYKEIESNRAFMQCLSLESVVIVTDLKC